ncbi:hypothetical protein Bca52824_034236 [Brassica carinata]|uniref:Uncharacterized protein n=1 Tax=Brassica carinata TaxID=52824 RepID=A0A8X7V0N2_BRACI|nr:hypothetical protein Bca52824_034236 [Brassica carinata]
MSGQENHDASQISTPSASEPKTPHSSDNAPNPKLDPNDVTPPPSPISGNAATTMPPEFNPYVFPSPVPKNTMDSVKDTLGKWGGDGCRRHQEGSRSLRKHLAAL